MKRVYVNEQWCLGCHLCEYYCAFAASGEENMARALKGKKISPKVNVEGDNKISFAVSCRHCKEPYCMKSCIAGAISKNEDGVVVVDKSKCVGCYTCVVSCPYGAISKTEEGPVNKCDLCINSKEGTPSCVKGCPNKAIVFEER